MTYIVIVLCQAFLSSEALSVLFRTMLPKRVQ